MGSVRELDRNSGSSFIRLPKNAAKVKTLNLEVRKSSPAYDRWSVVPLLLLAFILLAPVLFVLLLPLTLLQRYRAGTSRRRSRRWVATLNVVTLALSMLVFLASALISNLWFANTTLWSLGGLVAGAVLGWIGLRSSRWEQADGVLHYTPNRWLVLLIILLVSARVLYSLWRTATLWSSGLDASAWLATRGVAGSFAVGAVVLGYYVIYWRGVQRRSA